jgi:hypothetical protein
VRFAGEVCEAPPSIPSALQTPAFPHKDEIYALPQYLQPQEETYLTIPEWYIVYSSREYASYLGAKRPPSAFPYLPSIAQFWCGFGRMKELTSVRGYSNAADYLNLTVIGTSLSVEYLVKTVYEGQVGAVTEFIDGTRTPEDAYAAKVAQNYATFLNTIPWYEYPFGHALVGLWRDTPLLSAHPIRSWERKIVLSEEYAVKAGYGWLIRLATKSLYDPATEEIELTVSQLPHSVASDPRVQVVKTFNDGIAVIKVPRYQAMSDLMEEFAQTDIAVLDIAGGSELMVSALGERGFARDRVILREPFPTDPDRERVIFSVAPSQLLDALRDLKSTGAEFEHIYDY